MKNLIYLTGLLFTGLLLWTGCTKEDIETYSGEDAIYFAQQWGLSYMENHLNPTGGMKNAHQTYSKIGFGEMIVSDSLLEVNIQTSGFIKDYDRKFNVEVVADSTTAIEGTEYEIIDTDLMIPAGQSATTMRIMFHKTPRMNDENLQLQIRLVPGEHFVLPFGKGGYGKMPIIHSNAVINNEFGMNTDPAIHNIFINNFLVEPSRWGPLAPSTLGIWSEKKYRLLLDYTGEMLGWTVATWNDEAKMWPPATGYQVGLNYLGKYLREQYEKGREYWVLDPDGTMMWCNHEALAGLWSEDTRPEQMMDK